jgi:AraC-like DNA-binding protein
MPAKQTEKAQGMGELIAGAGFISAAIAPADRFEAWREAMAPSHDIRPAQGGFGAPQVASIGWHLDDLLCSDLAFSPIGYRRWRGKSEGGVLLRLYEEGQAHGLVEEASFQTRPGEVHLFGLAPECRGVTAEWHRVKSVLIPYAAVRYDPGRHPAHISVGADTAVGRILWSSIQSLFAELPHARRAEASALAAGFASLVHGLLLSAAPSASSGGDFDAARHLAMRRYLDDNLEDPELGVASLCAAFGASRATIYRDFAADGGVERFIVRRRLDRAFRELAIGPPDRGRLRRVAERWGFACPYHFSRAFRRQFDLWPSEVFEAEGADGGAATAPASAIGLPATSGPLLAPAEI